MHPAGGTRTGMLLAGLIMAGWLISLIVLSAIPLSMQPPALIAAVVLLRTLLHTGLFIVGHDAMHGLLLPTSRRFNDAIGSLVLALYAGLPYGACRRNHRRHHRFTASGLDPDFHPDPGVGLLGWYRRFMTGYLSGPQMVRLLGGWAALALLLCYGSAQSPALICANLLLVCVLPLLFSSLQLFVFGTYLPHRHQRLPRSESGPRSLDLPTWLSLLLCYHFCYHREHHDNPGLSWHQLPALRRRPRQLAPA